jgi:nitroreductase
MVYFSRIGEATVLDAFECVATKLDVREFDSRAVQSEVKLKVLEAARMTGSGNNSQHWRFILVQDPENLSKLAGDSTTGKWVERANFAVIVLIGTKFGFYMIDAGRAVQNMQIAAWNFGVASGVFTGVNPKALQEDFKIPTDLTASIVVGFGYPIRRLIGRKYRKPIEELVFAERYGEAFNSQRLKT